MFSGCGARESPAETKEKPSAAAGTYHGEVFRARERANDSLEKTDRTRRQQIKEVDEFERKPAPKADPTP
jgi:hypothetical protein